MAFSRLLDIYRREQNAARGLGPHIELELRFTVPSLDEYKRLLLGVLADADMTSVSRNVAIIKRPKINPASEVRLRGSKNELAPEPTLGEPDRIATREYTDVSGRIVKSEVLTYSTKRRIALERVAGEFIEYKMAVAAENPKASPGDEFDIRLFSILRIKLRLSATMLKFPAWRFDFTLVKEMHAPLTPEFAKYRDALFCPGVDGDNFISSAPWDAAQHYEFEIEHVGDDAPHSDEVYQLIDYVRTAGCFRTTHGSEYQETIHDIAKLLYPPSKAATFHTKLGRKDLGPRVVGLTREIFAKDVRPNIVGMHATIKLDGEGVIGMISAGKMRSVGGTLYSGPAEKSAEEPIVYDSELYEGKQHVFDVYVYGGQNLLTTSDLGVRQKYIPAVAKLLGDVATPKTHVLLTEDYAQQLRDLWSQRENLHVDGIIIDNKWKWKPLEAMTIDFLTMTEVLGSNDYILFSGIDKSQERRYNIRPLSCYIKLFRGRTFHDYHPIQFAPGDKPNAYMFKAPAGTPDLHGRICEYRWLELKQTWEFVRIRTDRDAEVARGSYLGNNIAVAIATWESIHNPLTFEMLCGDDSDAKIEPGYFGTTDQKYVPANKFSSFVKEQSIRPFQRLPWVIDLACGRGADICRWSRLAIKYALCVDNDLEALKELISRHQGLQHKSRHYKLIVHTHRANLNDPYAEQEARLRKAAPGMPNGVPLIVCNMALHYMCESDASIWNFIMLIDRLMEVGGHFIFTCYNGARIYDLIGDKPQVDFTSGDIVKYSIKRDYMPGPLKNFGQPIQPLLGCAGGVYRQEFLVNIAYWIRMFKQRGFKLVEQVRFNSLLSKYSIDNIENYDLLDDADHSHLGLYDYVVLQKEKQIAREPAEKEPSETTAIIALPRVEAGIPTLAKDINTSIPLAASLPAIEQLPSKDIKGSLELKHTEDIASGRVRVIVLPYSQWPARSVSKFSTKKGVVIKKLSASPIASGDRVAINNEFEVVIEEVARVSSLVGLLEKYTLGELSTTAADAEAWQKEVMTNTDFDKASEFVGLRVRKI